MKELLKLYSFESVHNTDDETALADWLEKWFKNNGVDVKRDGNNLYYLDEIDAPILSAHLDQVKTNGKAVHFSLDNQGHIRGYNENFEQTSLGADDKNGIWIIMQAVKEYAINFIISCGEESGCIGIKELEQHGALDSIDDATQYCLVLDRRGNKDILSGGGSGKYCSTLAQCLCNYLGNDDYAVTTGSLSDTATICQYCESVNMSVAYESPHQATEHTNWNRLQEIKDDVLKVLEDFQHYPTPPYKYTKQTSSITSYYSNKKWSEYDEDYSKYYGEF